MRFERLDILRYGALTDRRLVFRPGAKLHVIYGPNEAGKSSALAAISDLLFGFPVAAEMSFLHDPATLRVGAEITAKDGRAVAFRRRRGRKNTLLADGEAEEALPEDVLAPFLGTLNRDVFQRAFGLNSASLRAGGETMLKSGGEIGSLLFSAASGLTGLSSLRKTLEAEADGIYAQRRSKDRLFYQVLDAHEEARRAERDNELKSTDWKKLLSEYAAIETELASILSEREETKRGLERLRTLQRLEPIIREIDREESHLARFENLAGLPGDFEERLAEILDAARGNAEALQATEIEVHRLRAEIDALQVDEALIAATPRILASHAQKGAYLKAREDLARVRGEVEDFDQRLMHAARRLGFADAADLARGQPADAELARLKTLVDEGSELARSVKELGRRIEEERQSLRRLEEEGSESRLIDPKPWTEQFTALRTEINALSGLDELQVRLSRSEANFKLAVGRLDPPVRNIEAVLASPLPDIAALTNHRRLIDAARARSTQAATKVAALEAEAAELAVQFAALQVEGPIVSRDDIAAARNARDEALRALEAKPSEAGFIALSASIVEADRLADAALIDAERVSRHAQFTLRQREIEQALAKARSEAKDAEIELADALTDFEDAFKPGLVLPSTPERMIEWRRGVEDLSRLWESLGELRDEVEVLRMKEETLRPALLGLADAVGLAAAALPTLPLARGIERKLEETAARWSDSRAVEGKRHSARETLERLEGRETALRHQTEAWHKAFAGALGSIGLHEEATVEMALAALDAWRTVPDILSERDNRARRVRGMVRDMEMFEEDMSALCAELAPELASIAAEVAAGLLHERAMGANAEAKHRVALVNELKRAEGVLARAVAEAERLEAEQVSLAGVLSTDMAKLSDKLDDIRERARIAESLDQCRNRFAEHANGEAEETVRPALADFDRVTAALEIERLQAEDERQVDRISELRAAEADNLRRRRELEAGVGAERAVFLKLAAEEEARELARRWVVLKLAAGLLSSSMEAYRERQADPVMHRAGEVFAELTGGRFARLVQLYDESDELQLAVERKGGEQVPLTGLSEGTGDQLYLALRLAFLEDYCSRNEPAPLILDDIFQTFDDERTAAGLRTLAAAGDRFQTVLFTHHTSVVETARRELGHGLDLVML
jgi:uncharacterized protein YhaN